MGDRWSYLRPQVQAIFLPHLYAVFGRHNLSNMFCNNRVIDGVDSTLDSIERVPVNEKNRPLNEIILERVCICFLAAASLLTDFFNDISWTTIYAICVHHKLQITIHANPIADATLLK